MSRLLSLRPEAMAEIREAAVWYGERGLDLDVAFLDEVSRVLDIIKAHPARFATVDHEIRQAMLRRFPYSILYRVREDAVVVISCFHGRRDPQEWRRRL